MTDCRFCIIADPLDERDERELIHCETDAIAFHDSFPSAAGHILIVPTKHVSRVRELERYEWYALCDVAFKLISEHPAPGMTIGINDGPLAGQTIPHVHLHLIPRQEGDVPDPRGGIRWVLPETAAYWEPSQAMSGNDGGATCPMN